MPHKHHQHNHGKVSYLESPERRKEFSPEQLLDIIPLNKNDNLLDFGAGSGYFTIPVAKRISGHIYALDIDPDMLDMIQEKSDQEKITNIITVEGSIEALPIDNGSINVIIASLVLHEIQPLAPLLEQMNRMLAEDGYLVCLELEPKAHHGHAPRITLEGLTEEITSAGYDIKEKKFISESLYMLIAQKVG